MPGSRGLEDELRELERNDPAVKKAREELDKLPEEFARMRRHEEARRIVGPRRKERDEAGSG